MVCAAACLASALERQPNADYRARRVALAEKMAGGVAIVFAGTESEGPDATYGFRQDNNFYYLSGSTEPGAALVIVSKIVGHDMIPGRPYSEILFLPAHNLTQEKWTGPKVGADTPQVASLTGFDRVANLDQMPAELVKIFADGKRLALRGHAARRRDLAVSQLVAMAAPHQHLPHADIHPRHQATSGPVANASRIKVKSTSSAMQPTPRSRRIWRRCT